MIEEREQAELDRKCPYRSFKIHRSRSPGINFSQPLILTSMKLLREKKVSTKADLHSLVPQDLLPGFLDIFDRQIQYILNGVWSG